MTARLSLLVLSSKDPENFSLATIVNLLRVPPARRKAQQIKNLQHLTAEISFFSSQSELSELLHYQSCQSMNYEFFEKKQVVFNCGEIGDKFYIILSGKVEVSIIVPDPRRFVTVAILEDGQSFGELALLKESPRNATITCITECHMAVLTKLDYLRVLGKIHEKKISSFVDFLKEIPVFRSWSKRNVETLYHFFKPKLYNRHNSVFTIGQDPTHVYIVKSGEFEISKKVKIPDKKMKLNLKVAILAKGEIFGDEEVMENRPRTMNCVCYSATGEILAIKANDFLIKIKSDDAAGIIDRKNRAKSSIRESKAEVFGLLEGKREEKKAETVREKFNLLRKKYILPDVKVQDWSKYLELSAKDIEVIKGKAIRKKELKTYFIINRPAELSYRTSSPKLIQKSRTLSIPYSSRHVLGIKNRN